MAFYKSAAPQGGEWEPVPEGKIFTTQDNKGLIDFTTSGNAYFHNIAIFNGKDLAGKKIKVTAYGGRTQIYLFTLSPPYTRGYIGDRNVNKQAGQSGEFTIGNTNACYLLSNFRDTDSNSGIYGCSWEIVDA